jgi:DNA-binding transcriptional ArsR family regulator
MAQNDLQITTDESAFVKLLGTEGRVRILDVLLRKPHVTLTRAEIAELAGVDPTTFDRNKDVLEQLNCLEQTGDERTEYSLNIEHPVIEALGTTRAELLEYVDQIPRQSYDIDETEMRKVISQQRKVDEPSEQSQIRVAKQIGEQRATTEQ